MLGPRLVVCTALVNRAEGRSIGAIFGSPDDLTFHPSMTLFALAQPEAQVFRRALDKHFGGVPDPLTTEQVLQR